MRVLELCTFQQAVRQQLAQRVRRPFDGVHHYLNGKAFEATEETGKELEKNLKIMADEPLTFPNSPIFIWSDADSDTGLTGHTVTMIQFVDAEYGGVKVSSWLMDATNGNLLNDGMDLFSSNN